MVGDLEYFEMSETSVVCFESSSNMFHLSTDLDKVSDSLLKLNKW